MIEIDGSIGEGGGQVVRTVLSLAALSGREVRIDGIRAGRDDPGLAPQHLTAVRGLAQVCDAEVEDAELRSSRLVFRPRCPPTAGRYHLDVAEASESGSAGSVTLILQALVPPLLFAGGSSRLLLEGGTNVAWSPPFEYVDSVWLAALARAGAYVHCRLDRRGFYPRGGGRITAEVVPLRGTSLRPLRMERRGELARISGRAVACNLPAHIPQRMANRARNRLRGLGTPLRVVPRRETGVGPGAAITLTAQYAGAPAGFSALGEPGKPSAEVADEACDALLEHHERDSPVDEHLGDQLVLPLALAAGESRYRVGRVTGHLRTQVELVARFLDARLEIHEEAEGEGGLVVIEGAAWRQ